MEPSGKQQIEQLRTYLSEQGLKFTRQREAIAQVFFASEEHLSLLQLLELAQVQVPSIGYATVYRTMKLLTECGLASEHKFGESNVLYEPTHDGEHHDHIICNECGRIVEYEDDRIEQLQEELARQLGFEIVSHRHEIYGRCIPSCEERAKA